MCKLTIRQHLITASLTLAALVLASPASAAFTLLDDFEGSTVDQKIVGQTAASGQSWSQADSSDNAKYVVRDDSGNQVLAHEGSSNDNAALPFGAGLNILDSTKGTFFFRVKPVETDGTTFALALSDDSTPDTPFGGNSDKTVGINFAPSGLGNGDGFSMSEDTWHNVWVEVDLSNGAEGYNIFAQTEGAASRTQLTDTTDGLPFMLRDWDNPANGIQALWFKNNGQNGGDVEWHFDDFFLDNTGFNASNPLEEGDGDPVVPEPASMLLVGLGGAALLRRRRFAVNR